MPHHICFLQIQKDLQAAASAAVDKTVSARFVKQSYCKKEGPFSKKIPLSFSLFKTRKRIRAVSGKTNYPAFDAMSRLPASGGRTFAPGAAAFYCRENTSPMLRSAIR